MFAIIETKGATHIAIHVPHEGAEKSLPMLVRMLEQNAKFIQVSYNEAKPVTPEMSVKLGSSFVIEGYNHDPIMVADCDAILTEDFVRATPEVLTSNAASKKKAEEEQARMRAEITYLKSEIDRQRAQIEALTAVDQQG